MTPLCWVFILPVSFSLLDNSLVEVEVCSTQLQPLGTLRLKYFRINCAALITNSSAELVGWFWIYMIAPVCGGLLSWAFFHYAFLPTLLTMRQYNADKKNE